MKAAVLTFLFLSMIPAGEAFADDFTAKAPDLMSEQPPTGPNDGTAGPNRRAVDHQNDISDLLRKNKI